MQTDATLVTQPSRAAGALPSRCDRVLLLATILAQLSIYLSVISKQGGIMVMLVTLRMAGARLCRWCAAYLHLPSRLFECLVSAGGLYVCPAGCLLKQGTDGIKNLCVLIPSRQ